MSNISLESWDRIKSIYTCQYLICFLSSFFMIRIFVLNIIAALIVPHLISCAPPFFLLSRLHGMVPLSSRCCVQREAMVLHVQAPTRCCHFDLMWRRSRVQHHHVFFPISDDDDFTLLPFFCLSLLPRAPPGRLIEVECNSTNIFFQLVFRF
jgi:hypothetical protein